MVSEVWDSAVTGLTLLIWKIVRMLELWCGFQHLACCFGDLEDNTENSADNRDLACEILEKYL